MLDYVILVGLYVLQKGDHVKDFLSAMACIVPECFVSIQHMYSLKSE